MVTTEISSTNLSVVHRLLRLYLVVALAAVVTLAILSVAAPHQAPTEAWVHAVVVSGFAGLLLRRARSARRGSIRALRAVGLIAGALVLANVLLARLPGSLPTWMRIEALGIAVLMVGVVLLVVRERA